MRPATVCSVIVMLVLSALLFIAGAQSSMTVTANAGAQQELQGWGLHWGNKWLEQYHDEIAAMFSDALRPDYIRFYVWDRMIPDETSETTTRTIFNNLDSMKLTWTEHYEYSDYVNDDQVENHFSPYIRRNPDIYFQIGILHQVFSEASVDTFVEVIAKPHLVAGRGQVGDVLDIELGR